MNPETPKIVLAFVAHDGFPRLLDDRGRLEAFHPPRADRRLAESGQRAIWPDGHGVAVIEDIPKPEPLPPVYYYTYPGDPEIWSRWYCPPTATLVATVTFDEDGTPHVERVAS